MKKYIYILLSVMTLSFVSCDLDRMSPDSLPLEKAFENIQNIEALEGGLYSRLRTAYSMVAMVVPDMQADYVHAINGFSNTYGDLYTWKFTQDDKDVATVWQDFYGVIGLANFIIDGIETGLKFEVLPGSDEQKIIDRVRGVSYFIRALSYSVLAERFCADYDESTANVQYSGLPLKIKSGSDEPIPDRSTLEQVYSQINRDIVVAKKLLRKSAGVQNSTRITLDCINFLEARILLQTDKYNEAYAKAMEFISSAKAYSLVDSQEELIKMWEYDNGSETIFQFYASKTETAYQFGYYFCPELKNGMHAVERVYLPDYVPTKDCIASFDEKDWRLKAFFKHCSSLQMGEDGFANLPLIKGVQALADELYIVTKYPGNPDLRSSSAWNYINTFKVFRLPEIYLIAAEAGLRAGKDANTPLNALRDKRGLEAIDSVTFEDLMIERYHEMMFEGTRLTDLKRWNMGFKRGAAQSGLVTENGGQTWRDDVPFVNEVAKDIAIEEKDYRLTWPLPASEIFAHPAFASQQNPGWKR